MENTLKNLVKLLSIRRMSRIYCGDGFPPKSLRGKCKIAIFCLLSCYWSCCLAEPGDLLDLLEGISVFVSGLTLSQHQHQPEVKS